MMDMKKWLEKDLYHEVRIKQHCHGLRVTLYDGYHELVTAVGSTQEEAFQECLKNLPHAALQLISKKIEASTDRLKRAQYEVRRLKIEKKKLEVEEAKLSAEVKGV